MYLCPWIYRIKIGYIFNLFPDYGTFSPQFVPQLKVFVIMEQPQFNFSLKMELYCSTIWFSLNCVPTQCVNMIFMLTQCVHILFCLVKQSNIYGIDHLTAIERSLWDAQNEAAFVDQQNVQLHSSSALKLATGKNED